MKETEEAKETIYCESLNTALRDALKKCGKETHKKVGGFLPRLIKWVEQEKLSKFINTALLTVDNIQSPNNVTNDNIYSSNPVVISLEFYGKAPLPDDTEITSNKDQQFWEQFIELICIDLEEKTQEVSYCYFGLSVVDKEKSVPSLRQVYLSILQHDVTEGYEFILNTVCQVDHDCYKNKEDLDVVGFYERDTTNFTHKLRTGLVHGLRGYNIEAYQKLIVDFPVLASLPEFYYQPGQLRIWNCGV